MSVAASRLCLVSSLHLVGAFEVFQISLSLVHASLKFFDPDECQHTVMGRLRWGFWE